ncbi:MAG: tRNA uridine-5-carboxymethylaminomethyl(34) synthesis GTPase MnmE [Anaerovoracaceae bacterium]|jgi:tRNA modification GTPase
MEDTIAAIATAYGEGGIGIVRISGDQAKSILGQVFVPKKLPDISNIDNRRLYYGNIIDKDNSELIDEVLAVYMQGPRTYTAEDVVEIYCHGSIVSLRKTLSLVLRKGARLAEKGEFTKRAFLNGRLDLSQAEAVMDLISAKTDKSFNVALGQMEGQLSERIKAIRSELMDVLVNITVNLDYPDEDIEEITYNSLTNSLSAISDDIDKLIATADTGRIIREGLNVVIIGKPNVGKSSLMNALLKESRAIVTEIPGTTRDTIEEVISIRNIPVKITDTAGIRETDDAIEKIGIEKSKASFNRADLIILILDGSEPLSQEDYDIIDYVGNRKIIALINKIDLKTVLTKSDIQKLLPTAIVIETGIKESIGINELEDKLEDLVYGGNVRQEDSLLVTNVRHKDLLQNAKDAIEDAYEMAARNEALDFIEVDVRRGWELLGEIIGDSVAENIIDEVFARFCLGK